MPNEPVLTSEMNSSLQPTREGNNSSNVVGSERTEEPKGTAANIGDSTNYVFPQRRLKQAMNDPKKDPLVLVACGQAL